MRSNKLILIMIFIIVIAAIFVSFNGKSNHQVSNITETNTTEEDTNNTTSPPNELSIEYLRHHVFAGSDLVIEETLAPGSNYNRYIASYMSEGLKIYGLLTVPQGQRPPTGWPVIIFNHGFIPPAEYKTTERYVAYVDGFARNGYIVFKSDYRGHGKSEGEAVGAYGSNAYTVDVLNAVASLKRYKEADPYRIGMWGHSMGGYITLRSMVVNRNIKAGVIWAGVVGSYPDLLTKWRRSTPPMGASTRTLGWRQTLIYQYGSPAENPNFWNSISANAYLKDISGPLQLHHGTADTSVPLEFSEDLEQEMRQAGKSVELYIYPDDDHNLANSFLTAIRRSNEFFDKYLKNGN